MAVNDVMFNLGINVNADFDSSETLDVVQKIQDTLNKNGITVPISLNNATIKQMDEYVQSLGGNMKLTKDATTNLIDSITLNIPKANGQMLTLNQDVKAVYNSITDANGVTQQFFDHFESNGITTSINGMNIALERAKELQNDIIKTYEQRVDLEHQMATALVSGDSKEQASLQAKLTKNEALDNMFREQLAYLQQQATSEGVQVNLWEAIHSKISQIDANTADWTRTLTQSGQDAIVLAQNLSQSKKVLNDFADTYKKAMSTDGTKGQMLVQDLNNMKAQVDVVINAMTNLGATVDSTGAHYQGNITAVQELCTEYNKITRQLQEFNAQKQDQQNDTQMIEQTVQAYKAYRDQLDRINKLKKENATGVDMKAEQQQLDALKTSYKQLEQGILSNGEAVYKNTQYNRDKNQVTRNSIQAQKELNVTLQDNSLQDLIADTITYTFSLQSLQRVIQSIISETVSLNDSMTQIRLVTQGSSEDTKALMSDYSNIAKQLGTTTSAVADSAVEWLRQGNTVEETSELVKASTTLSVIGAMDASDATTALTASLNGYKMGAKDAMKIVDQLTTLDLKYATSSGDIANALSRVASSASAAGVPLEKMEAIITVTADQTQQAAETIGRAWNSVIQRINKISAGKDVSDTGKSLNDVDKALKTVGISLRDDNGIIKSSSDILDEVAAKWDTWNRNQQAQIATAIAGTNQANIFRATMNDYKEVLEATTIAENASGSATERMAICTESLTSKINTFKTTWTELVNDLNLDSLIGTVVDLGTKLLEILNLLLNKIPVLSTVLKGLVTAQGINILAGAIIKALNRIAGPEGIKGVLSGLVNLRAVASDASVYAVTFGEEFIAAFTGANNIVLGLGAGIKAVALDIAACLGPLGLFIAGLSAAGIAIYALYKNFGLDAQIDKANKKLDESQQSLDETDAKISEISSAIAELSGKPEEELTQSEKDRLETLEKQLQTYKDIRAEKQGIVDDDKAEANRLEAEKKDKSYTGSNTYDAQKSGIGTVADFSGIEAATQINSGNSFATYLAQLKELEKVYPSIMNGATQYGMSVEECGNRISQATGYLKDQVVQLQEDKLWYEETGQTASEGYQEVCRQLQMYDALVNSTDWENNTISELVDLDTLKENLDDAQSEVLKAQQDLADGVEGVTEETVENALNAAKDKSDEILTDVVNDTAEKIMNDQTLREAAETAFNLDLSTLDGYIQLKNILEQDIPKALETAKTAAEESSAGFTTMAEVYDLYAEQEQNIAASTETLTAAFTEMTNQGYLNADTIKDLVAAYPELAEQLYIEDGQVKINTASLNDLANQYYDTAIAAIENQIQDTETTMTQINTRIEGYNAEIAALEALAAAGDSVAEQDVNNAYNNRSLAQEQLKAAQERVAAAQATITALRNQQSKGLQPSKTTKSTKKSGSSTKTTDPDKEAYELKKSEIGVVQKELELKKSALEQDKKDLEIQKKSLENDKKGLENQKKEIELSKQQKEQQLEIVQDEEESIDDIIELIKKMTKQDYENLKTKLNEVKDYIGDFKDALDDVKDTYDDLVDDAKDKLKAEKEAADNQKKLEDGAKSIAEIQAQLAEIQYDDSADAQAKRLELTASLNEKQQDLEDEMKDQAYDAATDALDKTKDKVDNIFDAIGDILDASQDAIADYVDYISDTLESEGNLYQAAVAQFNDTSEGAQEELYNRLLDWNDTYGDSINETVTKPWNEAIAAVEKYKDIVGSTDIDAIRQKLGSDDTSLQASIKLDQQSIDALDNQIDQIEIDVGKVDVQINAVEQQISQFEQAISQLKDALTQLEIDYTKKENAKDAGTTDNSKTGNEYAYGLVRDLLKESGVDVSTMPATWQAFVDALGTTTEAAQKTGDSLEKLADETDTTTPEIEGLGDSSEDAGSQIKTSGDQAQGAGEQADQTVQPLTDVAQSGEQAAEALGQVATAAPNASGDGSSGSTWSNLLTFLTGGDTDKFVQQFATKAISKYLPKLIKAGVSMIGKLHDGTDEVKKSNSWLDKMLGLGQDETARILKVGEAVIPDYANDAVQNVDSTAIRPVVTAPNTSNVRTTNNSELNIDMGDLDISGIDTTELRNELANIKKESANQVYSTLYRYIKVGGYRNVRNRYN